MNAEDKQKTEDYEKNRHIVTVKKDLNSIAHSYC